MELRRDEFPVTLEAYDVRDTKENFVAEQMVNTQAEADNFMAINAGRLIKTREVRPAVAERAMPYRTHKKKSAITPLVLFILLLVVLVVVGFVTGWIPDMISKYS